MASTSNVGFLLVTSQKGPKTLGTEGVFFPGEVKVAPWWCVQRNRSRSHRVVYPWRHQHLSKLHLNKSNHNKKTYEKYKLLPKSALFWRRILKIGIHLDFSVPITIHIINSNHLPKHLRIGFTWICVSALQDQSIAGIPGLSLPWLAWNLSRKCLLACQAHCHGSSAIRCSPDIKIPKYNTKGIFESSGAVQPKASSITQRLKVHMSVFPQTFEPDHDPPSIPATVPISGLV